ncbi:GTP-binding protein [Lacrimispora sp. NSJ-141]|uniref:GTP-binding protein n=1 Tax=Lientehia hominis TaxID=2897778 RepID=A0AAP2RGP5_9FIRM|nr:GTP-binding protein [Lientehia hominis]MCD2491671.1 GTP-binding protein [Lientehia hominis]
MKILVISGFLGAGKTTFIKALARHTGKDFAILENEYGSVGVDGDTLKDSMDAGKVNIWEMAEGCICCSMKGDFTASVLTIANTVDPEYLVIEPTGVGMLSNIIRSLQEIEYERISLLAPVTIVDGHSYERYCREFPELYRDQIASARTVAVSKMEQADEKEREALGKKLSDWNPDGLVVTEHYSAMGPDWWNGLLELSYDGQVLENTGADAEGMPDTFSLSSVSLESPERLILLMEQIIYGQFGDIFRAKGHLRAGGRMFQFDVADGQYSVMDIDTDQEGKAVFIGNGIRRQKLRRVFFRRRGKGAPVKARAEVSRS